MKKWLKLLSAALLFLPAAANAQWTTDYSKNTQVTPVGLNYDENEVVTNDDGITYAFFIIQSNGTLDMRLQILDKQGNKVMAAADTAFRTKPTRCGRRTTSTWHSTIRVMYS